MKNFFDDVDDSSDEESLRSEEETQSEVSDSDEEINNKWMRSDSDTDSDASGDGQVGVRSKNAKALEKIQNLSDSLDFQIDSSWKDSLSTFEDLVVKTSEYRSKQGITPGPFISTLQMLTDVFKSHEEEPLARESFSNKEEFTSYGKLSKKVAEAVTENAAAIERQKLIDAGELVDEPVAPEPEDNKNERDWSPEGMRAMLSSLVTLNNKQKVRTCKGIVSHATEQGLPQFVIAALGQLTTAILTEDQTVAFVSTKAWKASFDTLVRCYELSQQNKQVLIHENLKFESISDKGTAIIGFATLVSDLYDKYVEALQFADRQQEDTFMPRIQEEDAFLNFTYSILAYYRKRGTKKAIVRLSLIIIDILHSRKDVHHQKLLSAAGLPEADLREELLAHHSLVAANGGADEIQKATLQLAYHLALHDKFQEARDLLLQCKLDVYSIRPANRVTYNRIIAQLGLAAFRLGNYADCNNTLNELCNRSTKDLKILLGQAIPHQHFSEASAQKELLARRRLLPFHRQMSAEIIEAASLTSAMLTAVVSEAKKPYERSNRPKHFAKLVTQQTYALLSGVPANFREGIVYAFNAMSKSDLTNALSLADLSVWHGLGVDREATLNRLRRQVMEDSLRVFIINHGSSYTSIDVQHLSQQFQLEPSRIHAVVSQMLLDRDNVVVGYWDDKEEFLTIERGAPSRLHHLAEQSADRLMQVSGGQPTRGYERRGRGRGGYRRQN